MTSTLQPARVKSYRPWPAGSARYHEVIATLAGGAKGTGKHIARASYNHSPIGPPIRPELAATIRDKFTAIATAYGYTIQHWPKELRPAPTTN